MGSINIRKRGNVYQYSFEIAKIGGKRKQITKSGFRTKNEAYIAGQKADNEFINGDNTKESNMLYSEYLDYWCEKYYRNGFEDVIELFRM